MGKRFTDSEKYRDKWYRRLPLSLKVGWDYLYHECDSAGVIELDEDMAEFCIGCQVDWEALREAAGHRIEVLPSGRWFLVGFIEFQYGKLSPQCKPHLPVLSLLKKHGIAVEDVKQREAFKYGNVTDARRKQVLERDNCICCYCGGQFEFSELEPDHVTPKSKGGNDSMENLVAACYECNRSKSDKDLEVFLSNLPNRGDILVRLRERLPERVFDTLKEKEKDKDKEKDKEKDKDKQGGAGGDELDRIESPRLRATASEWLAYKRERREGYKPTGLKGFVSRVLSLVDEHSEADVTAAIQRAMANGWKGFEHGLGDTRGSPTPQKKPRIDFSQFAKEPT